MNKYSDPLSYLLQSEQPAIIYQTLKYLTEEPIEAREYGEQILKKGWGLQLMNKRGDDGLWAKGLYSPKWISTAYTMLLLRRFEAPVTMPLIESAGILMTKGLYSDNGINYFKNLHVSETCVTGMILYITSFYLTEDRRNEQLVNYLLTEQMSDGGWNCQRYKGASHSSFHTTINVLEGLLSYRINIKKSKCVLDAEKRGVEFLLNHSLYKSHRTGEIVDRKMTMFSFPPRWRYDVMRFFDYAQLRKLGYDSRMNDGVELLKKKKIGDGFFKMQNKNPGKIYFEMDKPGKIGLWNTLRGMRIIKWLNREHIPV